MSDSVPAWIYLRKSRALGEDEEDNGKLLDAHRAVLLRLAQQDGVPIPAGAVQQELVSADTIAERPVFSALLAHIEALPKDAGGVLYVTAIDRLSRGSMTDQDRVRRAFARANVVVRTPGRYYNLRDVDEEFMFEIEALFARRELRLFKKRQALKREELRRNGRSPNMVPPFPYEIDRSRPRDPRWVPHPVRFPLAQRWCQDIFTLSLRAIAARDGVSVGTVQCVLTNPAICGWPCRRYEPHEGARNWLKQDHQPLPRDRWQWPERQGDYPAVCTRSEWEAIQRVLAARRVSRAERGSLAAAWCRPVVRFLAYPDAPAYCSNYYYKQAPARSYLTYQIGNRRGRHPDCPILYVARQPVHDAAEAALGALFRDPTFRAALAAEAMRAEEQRQHPAPVATDCPAIEARLSAARRRLEQIIRRELGADAAELTALASLRAEAKGDIAAAEAALNAAMADPGYDPTRDALLPALAIVAKEWPAFWEAASGEEKAAAVQTVIERIWVGVERRPGERTHHRWIAGMDFRPWVPTIPALVQYC